MNYFRSLDIPKNIVVEKIECPFKKIDEENYIVCEPSSFSISKPIEYDKKLYGIRLYEDYLNKVDTSSYNLSKSIIKLYQDSAYESYLKDFINHRDIKDVSLCYGLTKKKNICISAK